VANGALDMTFDWWEHRKFSVAAKIVSGNARAFIPTDSSFHLVAKAASGKISNDFGDYEVRPNDKVQTVEMDVGDKPLPSIEMQATEGNISLIEANP
jgi:hypothetical protein